MSHFLIITEWAGTKDLVLVAQDPRTQDLKTRTQDLGPEIQDLQQISNDQELTIEDLGPRTQT